MKWKDNSQHNFNKKCKINGDPREDSGDKALVDKEVKVGSTVVDRDKDSEDKVASTVVKALTVARVKGLTMGVKGKDLGDKVDLAVVRDKDLVGKDKVLMVGKDKVGLTVVARDKDLVVVKVDLEGEETSTITILML